VTVNLFGDDWDGGRDRPGWQWKRLGVGERLGAERIGATLYELAPGQRTFPYHWHQVQEEWLIVRAPTLREASGERTLAPGDCVLFKRGPEGAHTIRNDTGDPVRLLMLSSDEEAVAEVAFYPDSGKVGIFGPGLRKLLREDAEIDYFEGEE
jgi:uncharacterized cupin superfamily protein